MEGAIRYDSSGNVVEFCDGSAWAAVASAGSTFAALGDTPANFTGAANQLVRVNVGETGLEFLAANEVGVWSLGSGDEIYYNSGTPLVGIGVVAPDDTLDIAGTLQVTGDSVFGGLVDLTGTGATTLQRGTTGQRPAGTNGMFRYNSDNDKFEGFQNGNWQDVLTDASIASGLEREIQFNSGGAMGSDAGLVYTSAGLLSIGGDTEVGGTFDVTGATILGSTLSVVGDISDSDSDVTIADGLNVTGAVDFDTTFNVDGAAVFNSTVGIGDATPDVMLDVDGALQI